MTKSTPLTGEVKAASSIPWREKTASDRVRPRECVREARDALNRAYGLTDRAPIPILLEALDWLRRALEQMAPEEEPLQGMEGLDEVTGFGR